MDVGDKVNDERAAFEAALAASFPDLPARSDAVASTAKAVAFAMFQAGIAAARRTPSASIGEDGLPELPKALRFAQWTGGEVFAYTADQMRQYAREAVAADRRARMDMPKIDAKTAETRMDTDLERAHGGRLLTSEPKRARQSQGGPIAWIRFRSDGGYEGPIMHEAIEEVRKKSGAWTPLYAAPPLSSEPQTMKGTTE